MTWWGGRVEERLDRYWQIAKEDGLRKQYFSQTSFTDDLYPTPTLLLACQHQSMLSLPQTKEWPTIQKLPTSAGLWLAAAGSCSSQSGPPPCIICSRSQTRLMNVHSVHVTIKQPWKQSESRFSLPEHKQHANYNSTQNPAANCFRITVNHSNHFNYRPHVLLGTKNECKVMWSRNEWITCRLGMLTMNVPV